MELELITGACAPQKQIGNSDLDDLRGALDDQYADDLNDHWAMIMPGKMLVIIDEVMLPRMIHGQQKRIGNLSLIWISFYDIELDPIMVADWGQKKGTVEYPPLPLGWTYFIKPIKYL